MKNKTAQAMLLPKRWIALSWLSLLFTILVIGTIGGLAQGDPEPVVKQWGISDFGIFAILLHGTGMAVAVYILAALYRKHGWSVLQKYFGQKLTLPSALWAIGGAAVAFVLYPAVEYVLRQISVPMYWGQTGGSHLVLGNTFSIILTLIGAVILSPIMEEILFRGFLYDYFSGRNYSQRKSILFAILIFTSVHIFFGLGMMVYIFLWSFIPFCLYLKFKSLYPCVLFHIINNLLAYVVLPLNGF